MHYYRSTNLNQTREYKEQLTDPNTQRENYQQILRFSSSDIEKLSLQEASPIVIFKLFY